MTIQNPYWDAVEQVPNDELFGSLDDSQRFTPTCWSSDYQHSYREELTEGFSWAISSPEAVEFIVKHVGNRAVVEVGAGTGYWAWLLTQHSIDVNAYDTHPPSEGKNLYHCPKETQKLPLTPEEHDKKVEWWTQSKKIWTDLEQFTDSDVMVGEGRRLAEKALSDLADATKLYDKKVPVRPGVEWVPIQKAGVEALALPENAGRVLFLSWPPYDKPFGAELVEAFGGDTIIYFGEGEGGCCGDDKMFELLFDRFELIDSMTPVQWAGLHDVILVFRRKP